MSDERLMWTVRRSDGGTDGPFSEATLRDMIARSAIAKTTLVRFGETSFRPALEWPQLQGIDVKVAFDPMRLLLPLTAVVLIVAGVGGGYWFFLSPPDSPATDASVASAVKAVDELVAKWPVPASEPTNEASIERARARALEKNFSACEVEVVGVAAKRPLDEDDLLLFVECSTSANREGLAKYRERLLAALEQSEGRFFAARGLLAASLGRDAQAQDLLQRALAASPQTLSIRLSLARLSTTPEAFFATLKPAMGEGAPSPEVLDAYHQGALRFGRLWDDEQLLTQAMKKGQTHAVDLLSDLYAQAGKPNAIYTLLSHQPKLSIERQYDLMSAAWLLNKKSGELATLASKLDSSYLRLPGLLAAQKPDEALALVADDDSFAAKRLKVFLLTRQGVAKATALQEAAQLAATLEPKTPDLLLLLDIASAFEKGWPDDTMQRCKDENSCEPMASFAEAVFDDDRESSVRLETLFGLEDALHAHNPHQFILIDALLNVLQARLTADKQRDEADVALLALSEVWLHQKIKTRAAGDEGRVIQALFAFEHERFDDAQRLLSSRIKDPEAPGALRGLYGRILESSAPDIAEEYWTELQSDDDAYTRPADLALARLAKQGGDTERSLGLFRTLFAEGVKSPEVLDGLLQSGTGRAAEGANE